MRHVPHIAPKPSLCIKLGLYDHKLLYIHTCMGFLCIILYVCVWVFMVCLPAFVCVLQTDIHAGSTYMLISSWCICSR